MAAARAIEEVQDSMILGLGKGIDRRIRDRGPGSINVKLLIETHNIYSCFNR
jgi:hypothetical protein